MARDKIQFMKTVEHNYILFNHSKIEWMEMGSNPFEAPKFLDSSQSPISP